MGIISRFTSLMKANMNHLINQSRDPEKIIQDTWREVNFNLRTVQSEANALEADVKRAKRKVDECESEIRKLERYKKRAQDQDLEKMRLFEREQEEQEKKKLEYLASYNHLKIEMKQLELLEEKLSMDIRALEAKKHSIREKAALLEQKQKINESSPASSGFNSYEEELNFKLDEAEALASLRNRATEIDSIDEEIAKLEKR